jgi:hypothetical protein
MLIHGQWTDSTRTLTLSRDPQGKLGRGRKFHVVLADSSQNHLIELSEGTTQVKL